MRARKHEVHNSDPVLKTRLRETFAGKTGQALCFDLFCGEGTYTKEIYSKRFRQVVCVDKNRKSLSKIKQVDNARLYCGDNEELAPQLCVKYGFPDFVDLDAFGNPDAPLVALMPWAAIADKQEFAIVATDGTMMARTMFSNAPACWGLGECKWSSLSVPYKDYPYFIFRNIEAIVGRRGYVVDSFECYRKKPPSAVCYYGAVIKRQ